jgi:predicted N-acetyltransferase YhbS
VLTGRIASVAATFVPGLQLAREFCASTVRPLLAERFPRVPYAVALVGPGSEVLGFDTERSVDHDWGPRLQVFLGDSDAERYAPAITETLASSLPKSFRGYRVAFPVTREPDGIARHRVEVTSLGAWLDGRLGFDPRQAVTLLDWLAVPAQRLAEFTGGEVFHDGPGELTRARAAVAWYPHDVWLYLLACQWQRIQQEEAFPGRCAEAGDDLGSAVVTARLARDLMRLVLLMGRRYPPYSKWLGTALARLPVAAALTASLTAAITAGSWPVREQHLRDAYETVAALHNQLGLTAPLDTHPRGFYDRPYQVIGAARFTAALREAITDQQVRRLPLTGGADQFVDSSDAAGDLRFLRACAAALVRESSEKGQDSVLIRREEAADVGAIHAITVAAFARPGQSPGRIPGEDPAEARLVDELRAGPAWLPALSMVAVTPAGDVIGHVLCTRGHVAQTPALGLGPLTVRPDHQRRGVGSALMHAILGAADALGEPLVALLGDPAYYSRFGFQPSSDYQIVPPDPQWGPYFQVRTLASYQPSVRGMFAYAEPFDRT